MSSILTSLGIDQLSVEDRLQLVQEIWESLEHDPDPWPITEAQKRELDRRVAMLDANPGGLTSWDVVEARVRARLGR